MVTLTARPSVVDASAVGRMSREAAPPGNRRTMVTRAGSRALLEFGLHPIIKDATGTQIDPAFGPEPWG